MYLHKYKALCQETDCYTVKVHGRSGWFNNLNSVQVVFREMCQKKVNEKWFFAR